MTQSLSSRSLRILVCIADHIRRDGYSPTYREIQQGCGLRSTSAVSHHLDTLQARGLIRHGRHGTARALSLTGDGARLAVEVAMAMQRHPAGKRRAS